MQHESRIRRTPHATSHDRPLYMHGRHYEGSIVLGSAFKRSATALLVPCFFLCVMICLFAGLMFYLEGPNGGGQA